MRFYAIKPSLTKEIYSCERTYLLPDGYVDVTDDDDIRILRNIPYVVREEKEDHEKGEMNGGY